MLLRCVVRSNGKTGNEPVCDGVIEYDTAIEVHLEKQQVLRPI